MKRTLVLSASCALLVLARPVRPQEAGGVQVIVSASNTTTALPRDRVADLFLKKVGNWADGATVLGVDQSMTSPVRERFSKLILGRTVTAVRRYWEERVFSGRGVPPPIKPSDVEVIEFVGRNPAAIGYVSGSAKLSEKVKVLRITD